MERKEIEGIFFRIIENIERLIDKGELKRSNSNERILHHMFSSNLISEHPEKVNSTWERLWLFPEYKTSKDFLWGELNLDKPEVTKEKCYKQGEEGNFDFKIHENPEILIEWKGPQLYSKEEITKDLLKLLSEDNSTQKILLAIIASSKKCGEKHKKKLWNRFEKSCKFSSKVLSFENLANQNLHAYIFTISEDGGKEIFQGKVTEKNLQVYSRKHSNKSSES